MSVMSGGNMRRVWALLAALVFQVCLATSVEAQTPLPEEIPDFSQDLSRPGVQTVALGETPTA